MFTCKRLPLIVDEEYLDAAIEVVSEALRYIYISTFKAEIIDKSRGVKLKSLFDLLFLKAKDGVDVKLLINNVSVRGTIPVSNFKAIDYFKKAGIEVRTFPHNRICHAKLLIVDDYIAILGSHNLSVGSCKANFEVSYLVNSVHTVTCLKEIYSDVWGQAKVV